MPSWPSPTRTPAARSASSGSGSRVARRDGGERDVVVGEQLDERPWRAASTDESANAW